MFSEAITTQLIIAGSSITTAISVALIARTSPKKITEPLQQQIQGVEGKVDGNYSAMEKKIDALNETVLKLTGDKNHMIGKVEGIAEQKAEQEASKQ